MIQAIIFDFDGVIHDTFDFHHQKINEFAGIELTQQQFRDIHNGNFFDDLPDEVKNISWEDYRDYVYHDMTKLEIKTEIRDIIHDLGSSYPLFIITSGGTQNISEFLGNNNTREGFKEILGMEKLRSKIKKFEYIFRQYHIGADDSIFVTDTLGDILEGNKVGVKTVAVDFGFHDEATLQQGNPYKIISHLNDLKPVIEGF